MRKQLEQFLGEFVYGAIDGTVTTFAVVAAAAGAGLNSTVVIILGLANLVGDGFSMGASSYLAAKSERDLKQRQHTDSGKTGSVEHGETPLSDGLITFAAFVIVGFIPLVSYVADSLFGLHGTGDELFIASMMLTALTFIGVGLLKARVTKTSRLRASLETLLLGSIAAALAYGLGDFLGMALNAR